MVVNFNNDILHHSIKVPCIFNGPCQPIKSCASKFNPFSLEDLSQTFGEFLVLIFILYIPKVNIFSLFLLQGTDRNIHIKPNGTHTILSKLSKLLSQCYFPRSVVLCKIQPKVK